MKKLLPSLVALLVIAATALLAQTNSFFPDRAGPAAEGHRPPPSALMLVLDTNHDGELSADEIANAPAALRALDINGDGKLDRDELRPPFPPPDCPPPPQG